MADENTAIRILNDETFTNALDKIIERDFFPDMPEIRHFLNDPNVGNETKKCFKYKISLNGFLNNYVSEENFIMNAKIKKDNDDKHKNRYAWLYEQQKSLRCNALMFNQTPSLTYNKKNIIGIRHKNSRSIKFLNKKRNVSKKNMNENPLIEMLKTPEIIPGAVETPLLTWGNVTSTPVIIENNEPEKLKKEDEKE